MPFYEVGGTWGEHLSRGSTGRRRCGAYSWGTWNHWAPRALASGLESGGASWARAVVPPTGSVVAVRRVRFGNTGMSFVEKKPSIFWTNTGAFGASAWTDRQTRNMGR